MTYFKNNLTIYIIAGVCIALCIGVIIFGLRILKETRKLEPKKNDDESDTESPV